MEQILHTFGIDWRLLLINAVNFGLLMGALWYFLYAPISRMLEERRQTVEKGVRDAQEASAKLAALEAERASALAQAAREAEALVAEARSLGAQKRDELVSRGETAAAALLAEAEARAGELKERAVEESKQEVAKLIVLGMERTLRSDKKPAART